MVDASLTCDECVIVRDQYVIDMRMRSNWSFGHIGILLNLYVFSNFLGM